MRISPVLNTLPQVNFQKRENSSSPIMPYLLAGALLMPTACSNKTDCFCKTENAQSISQTVDFNSQALVEFLCNRMNNLCCSENDKELKFSGETYNKGELTKISADIDKTEANAGKLRGAVSIQEDEEDIKNFKFSAEKTENPFKEGESCVKVNLQSENDEIETYYIIVGKGTKTTSMLVGKVVVPHIVETTEAVIVNDKGEKIDLSNISVERGNTIAILNLLTLCVLSLGCVIGLGGIGYFVGSDIKEYIQDKRRKS